MVNQSSTIAPLGRKDGQAWFEVTQATLLTTMIKNILKKQC
jgi:hypothetical protein